MKARRYFFDNGEWHDGGGVHFVYSDCCCCGLECLEHRIRSRTFDLFFAKFKLVAAQKDAATLTSLMMPGFSFIWAQGVFALGRVFKGLDANEGLQWTNLQQSVQGQPMPYRLPDSNSPARVLQCTPTETIYMCLVMCQQDIHHRWRWKSMIMPTR